MIKPSQPAKKLTIIDKTIEQCVVVLNDPTITEKEKIVVLKHLINLLKELFENGVWEWNQSWHAPMNS